MSGLESAPVSWNFHYSLSQAGIFSWVSYKAYVSAGFIDNISVHALAMCEICPKQKWKIPLRRYFSISHETYGILMILEGIKKWLFPGAFIVNFTDFGYCPGVASIELKQVFLF